MTMLRAAFRAKIQGRRIGLLPGMWKRKRKRKLEAEAVEAVLFSAEARKIHRFRFHIGGKNRGRKKIGFAILRRRTNRGSINIKK